MFSYNRRADSSWFYRVQIIIKNPEQANETIQPIFSCNAEVQKN